MGAIFFRGFYEVRYVCYTPIRIGYVLLPFNSASASASASAVVSTAEAWRRGRRARDVSPPSGLMA
jgi:hypothetical protein